MIGKQIDIQVTLSRKELNDASWVVQPRSTKLFLVVLLAFLVVFLAIMLIGMPIYLFSRASTLFDWSLAIVYTATMVVVMVYGYFTRPSRSGKLSSGDSNMFRFSDRGLIVEGSDSHVQIPWSDIPKARSVKGLILVMTTKGIAYVLPERSMENLGQLQAFRDLLRAHVSDVSEL